jgi:hypothetical protein
MIKPNWIERLKARWQLKSARQVVIILIVFACTGITVLAIKKPLLEFLGGDSDSTLASILYYIFILPIYNVFLLAYGFVFGQFNFFWEFEKRSFNRLFRRSKK